MNINIFFFSLAMLMVTTIVPLNRRKEAIFIFCIITKFISQFAVEKKKLFSMCSHFVLSWFTNLLQLCQYLPVLWVHGAAIVLNLSIFLFIWNGCYVSISFGSFVLDSIPISFNRLTFIFSSIYLIALFSLPLFISPWKMFNVYIPLL